MTPSTPKSAAAEEKMAPMALAWGVSLGTTVLGM